MIKQFNYFLVECPLIIVCVDLYHIQGKTQAQSKVIYIYIFFLWEQSYISIIIEYFCILNFYAILYETVLIHNGFNDNIHPAAISYFLTSATHGRIHMCETGFSQNSLSHYSGSKLDILNMCDYSSSNFDKSK